MKDPASRKRVRVGDVVEIHINGHGFAYLQLTAKQPILGMGWMIRVLPGIHKDRPPGLAALAALPGLWRAFVPVNYLVAHGDIPIVGNFPVPEAERGIPIVKSNSSLNPMRKQWFVIDGEKTVFHGTELPAQYHDCPMDEICGLEVIEDRIVTGWHPRDEVQTGMLVRGLRSREAGKGDK